MVILQVRLNIQIVLNLNPIFTCFLSFSFVSMLRTFLQGTNLLSKLIKIQVKALCSFSALKTQFLGSVRSVSNHMLLGIMQNGICLKAYTQKFIVVSQILSYSFIPRINYQS